MDRQTTTNLVTYGLLAATAIASFVLPEVLTVSRTMASGGSPGRLELMGVVRDFKGTHPDFDVIPAAGSGDYAGSIATVLGADGRPAFVDGAGYKVMAPWTDAAGRPIAPHLYVAPTGGGDGDDGGITLGIGVRTKGAIDLSKGALDAFDSTLGVYGAGGNDSMDAVVSTNSTASGAITVDGDSIITGNVLVGVGGNPASVIDNSGTITGTAGALDAPFDFPAITVPDDTVVGANVGDVEYGGGSTFTISSNLHTDGFRVKTNATVQIDGEVTILVEGEFRTETGGSIVVSPGSSLDLYITGSKVTIETKASWSDPTSTRMWVVGSPQMKLQTEAAFYGTIYAPDAKLLIQTKGHLYGSFIGNELQMKTEGAVHVDLAGSDSGSSDDDFGPGFAVTGKLAGKGPGVTFDGFDSTLGAYGGGNSGLDIAISSNSTASAIMALAGTTVTGDVLAGPGGNPASVITTDAACTITGTLGTLDEAVTMPTVSVPSGLGASVGDVTINGGVTLLNSNVHCTSFKVKGGALVRVDGEVTVYTEGDFDISNDSDLELLPDATLRVYADGDVKVYGSRMNVNTADPSRAKFYLTGGTTFELDQAAQFYGLFAAPAGDMDIKNNSHFYGRFIGNEAKVDKCGVHIDLAGNAPPPASCFVLSDTVGAAGSTSSGGITSAATFAQWFADVPGVNHPTGAAIILDELTPGHFTFNQPAFFPIDGMMFGNEGDDHNYNFTYAIEAEFVYAECGGQYLDFEIGDGTWVFIDDRLVLDLGGVGTSRQFVELDRLGLVDGETYRLHFFYANRGPSTDGFKLTTNIELSTSEILPPLGAAFD